MLNQYQLNYLKELHDGHQLIHYTLREHEFVFRTLNPKEYQAVLNLTDDEEEFQDAVCQMSILYPEDYNFEHSPLAGVSQIMAPIIIEQSGYTTIDEIFDCYEEEKRKASRIEVYCMNLVKAAMPEYTYEEMESWTWQKLMKHVVRAEEVLAIRGIEVRIKRPETNEEEIQIPTVEDKAFVTELLKEGVDPMFYFKDQVMPRKSTLVESPFIGGIHWQNEGVIDDIRTQLGK